MSHVWRQRKDAAWLSAWYGEKPYAEECRCGAVRLTFHMYNRDAKRWVPFRSEVDDCPLTGQTPEASGAGPVLERPTQ